MSLSYPPSYLRHAKPFYDISIHKGFPQNQNDFVIPGDVFDDSIFTNVILCIIHIYCRLPTKDVSLI